MPPSISGRDWRLYVVTFIGFILIFIYCWSLLMHYWCSIVTDNESGITCLGCKNIRLFIYAQIMKLKAYDLTAKLFSRCPLPTATGPSCCFSIFQWITTLLLVVLIYLMEASLSFLHFFFFSFQAMPFLYLNGTSMDFNCIFLILWLFSFQWITTLT